MSNFSALVRKTGTFDPVSGNRINHIGTTRSKEQRHQEEWNYINE
jgi:hypothetical protein